MIAIGLDDDEKGALIERTCQERGIRKVYVCSPERFAPNWAPAKMTEPAVEGDGRRGLFIDWPDLQRYIFFYKLMQEVDGSTLLIVNECLRTQNRHDLTYNCLRNFRLQAGHCLIFQRLPVIDGWPDFATLFDLETQSRWKREAVGPSMLGEAELLVTDRRPTLSAIPVPIDAKMVDAYAREREKLLAEVRDDVDKDPHLLPRNLLLVSGKAKLPHVDPGLRYVGRNNRLKLPNLETYREAHGTGERVVFELPHNPVELADFLTVSRQGHLPVLVADTKAERWYFDRFTAWAGRVGEALDLLATAARAQGAGGSLA